MTVIDGVAVVRPDDLAGDDAAGASIQLHLATHVDGQLQKLADGCFSVGKNRRVYPGDSGRNADPHAHRRAGPAGAECADFGVKYHRVMGPVCNIDLSRSDLECPVGFGQPVNELRWDAAGWDAAMVSSDPITHAMAREMCEQSLTQVRKAGGIAAEVYRLLIERPGRHADVDAMAVELGMNTRKTDMTIEEIALRLDYSDAANFRRAFTRWTQRSPSHFRGR